MNYTANLWSDPAAEAAAATRGCQLIGCHRGRVGSQLTCGGQRQPLKDTLHEEGKEELSTLLYYSVANYQLGVM